MYHPSRIAGFLLRLSCVALLGGARVDARAAERPNVLLILSDDQGWGDYGFMGHPHIKTPNLDRLARQSLTYTRGYVTTPLCRPSLASILTGLHPHEHGITGNDPNLPDRGVNPMASRADPRYVEIYETVMARIESHATFPRLLRDNGYLTLQTGKWWEGHPRRGGFTHAMTHGDPTRGGRHGDVGLDIGRKTLAPIHDFVREAKAAQAPFFIWYGVFLPHAPHNPPERLRDAYRSRAPTPAVANYWASCEWLDQTCGDLLSMLEDEGVRDNTLVVYLCDNGWIQDPTRGNRPAARSKLTPYEGGLRTPVLVHWPGRLAPIRDESTLVSSLDVAPTILRACGLEVPVAMQGGDLRDADALARRENRVFAASYTHNTYADQPARTLQSRVIIDGWQKLIAPVGTDTLPEIYDLKADPVEAHDLASTHPEQIVTLNSLLDAWWPGPESP